jgi:hypothetical protein
MEFGGFLRLVRALNDHGVDYLLVGGVALNVHGIVRTTEDVDLLIRASTDNVARLRRALHSVWDDESIDEIRAEDLAGEYPVIRYGPPEGNFAVDIVGRLGSAFSFDSFRGETVMIEGIPVRVVSPGELYEMKRGTTRGIDRADAENLKEKFRLE